MSTTDREQDLFWALVVESEAQLAEISADLERLDQELDMKRELVREIRAEARAMRSAYERRFGPIAGKPDPSNELSLEAVADPSPGPNPYRIAQPSSAPSFVVDGTLYPVEIDWVDLTRTDAVYLAVESLSNGQRDVSPGDVEDFLRQHGREDKRDHIGAALAYLNRQKRVIRLGRGRWVPARRGTRTLTE